MKTTLFSLFILLSNLKGFAQKNNQNDYWLLFIDSTNNECGYKNLKGEVVIKLGKYNACYTDTFKSYAVVLKPNLGFIAIDKEQNILYNVFPFDNGPDYVEDGLFRILKDNKIGYADAATGKVIIEPQFTCAFPFNSGIAKVSMDCKEKKDDEHKVWLSNNWFYIDKSGNENSIAGDFFNKTLQIAWNEDTINNYTFSLARDNRFAYSISKKDSSPEFYYGICRSTFDTLFLTYDHNKKPPFIVDYLVKEASGKGYIQYFTDGRKRMFLFFRPITRR